MSLNPLPPEYQAVLDYLYGFLNLETKRADRYHASKMDPNRPRLLLEYLGSPHNQYPTLHIAGTKGKGSVAAMCAYSLRAAGLKVGLYTSPHLKEFTERIRVLTPEDSDGRIPIPDLVTLVERLKTAVPHFPEITWFELTTALGFMYFAQAQVDVAVIEVGLGGRLDATNVITPLVSVITSLSYDHTYLLGNTLREIAGEKAGIIKPGVPVVTASQQPEALQRIEEVAAERGSSLTVIGQAWQYSGSSQHLTITDGPPSFIPYPSSFTLALPGEYQLENATVALAALNLVQSHFPALTLEAVQTGLAHTAWNGRLQILHQSDHAPTLLTDCAHNVDSMQKLAHELRHNYTYEKLILVFGATADKDLSGMLPPLFPLADTIVLTAADNPRATHPADLAALAEQMGFVVQTEPEIETAVTTAWQLATPQDLICVTGSMFIVGDLLNHWDSLKSHLIKI